MAILEEQYLEPAVIEIAADEDFTYPEHAPAWIWPGVCGTCGKLHPSLVLPAEPVNDLGGQAEAPALGSDEYLTW